MAKTQKVRRTTIGCSFYCGFLDEMPQDIKDLMLIKNPKLHKQIFGV
jgi:hypothetical protein